MKKAQILLSVIFGVGIFCGGGLLVGNSILSAFAQTSESVDRFSRKVLLETGSDWNPRTFYRYASPEFRRDFPRRSLGKLCETYRAKLGPIKTIGKFTSAHSETRLGSQDDFIVVTARAPLTCEKDKGHIEMKVIHRHSVWRVASFRIESPAIAKE